MNDTKLSTPQCKRPNPLNQGSKSTPCKKSLFKQFVETQSGILSKKYPFLPSNQIHKKATELWSKLTPNEREFQSTPRSRVGTPRTPVNRSCDRKFFQSRSAEAVFTTSTIPSFVSPGPATTPTIPFFTSPGPSFKGSRKTYGESSQVYIRGSPPQFSNDPRTLQPPDSILKKETEGRKSKNRVSFSLDQNETKSDKNPGAETKANVLNESSVSSKLEHQQGVNGDSTECDQIHNEINNNIEIKSSQDVQLSNEENTTLADIPKQMQSQSQSPMTKKNISKKGKGTAKKVKTQGCTTANEDKETEKLRKPDTTVVKEGKWTEKARTMGCTDAKEGKEVGNTRKQSRTVVNKGKGAGKTYSIVAKEGKRKGKVRTQDSPVVKDVQTYFPNVTPVKLFKNEASASASPQLLVANVKFGRQPLVLSADGHFNKDAVFDFNSCDDSDTSISISQQHLKQKNATTPVKRKRDVAKKDTPKKGKNSPAVLTPQQGKKAKKGLSEKSKDVLSHKKQSEKLTKLPGDDAEKESSKFVFDTNKLALKLPQSKKKKVPTATLR